MERKFTFSLMASFSILLGILALFAVLPENGSSTVKEEAFNPEWSDVKGPTSSDGQIKMPSWLDVAVPPAPPPSAEDGGEYSSISRVKTLAEKTKEAVLGPYTGDKTPLTKPRGQAGANEDGASQKSAQLHDSVHPLEIRQAAKEGARQGAEEATAEASRVAEAKRRQEQGWEHDATNRDTPMGGRAYGEKWLKAHGQSVPLYVSKQQTAAAHATRDAASATKVAADAERRAADVLHTASRSVVGGAPVYATAQDKVSQLNKIMDDTKLAMEQASAEDAQREQVEAQTEATKETIRLQEARGAIPKSSEAYDGFLNDALLVEELPEVPEELKNAEESESHEDANTALDAVLSLGAEPMPLLPDETEPEEEPALLQTEADADRGFLLGNPTPDVTRKDDKVLDRENKVFQRASLTAMAPPVPTVSAVKVVHSFTHGSTEHSPYEREPSGWRGKEDPSILIKDAVKKALRSVQKPAQTSEHSLKPAVSSEHPLRKDSFEMKAIPETTSKTTTSTLSDSALEAAADESFDRIFG